MAAGTIVLIWAAVVAVTIFFHELGHALFALACTRSPVLMVVGSGPYASFAVGRLGVKLGLPFGGGFCAHRKPANRNDSALIAAAGPVASALTAAIAYRMAAGAQGLEHVFLIALAIISFEGFVINLLPLRMGCTKSDGLAILIALGWVDEHPSASPSGLFDRPVPPAVVAAVIVIALLPLAHTPAFPLAVLFALDAVRNTARPRAEFAT